MAIYDKKAISESPGSLDLSGISKLSQSSVVPLEKMAEQAIEKAKQTYINSSESEARNEMGRLFNIYKSDPTSLANSFNDLKNSMLEEIQEDETKIEFLTRFELASGPYLRRASEASLANQNKNLRESKINSLYSLKQGLADGASIGYFGSGQPQADYKMQYTRFQTFLQDPDIPDVLRRDGQKFLDRELPGYATIQAIDQVRAARGEREALKFANKLITASPSTAREILGISVTNDGMKELQRAAKDYADSPEQSADVMAEKQAIMSTLNNVSSNVREKKEWGEGDLMQSMAMYRNAQSLREQGVVRPDDAQTLKAEEKAIKLTGEAVLNDGVKNKGGWFSTSTDKYAQEKIKELYEGDTRGAAGAFLYIQDKLAGAGWSSTDDKFKRKVDMELKKYRADQYKNGVKGIVGEATSALTSDGILMDLDFDGGFESKGLRLVE